ncbi:MAG: hypothetical protein Q4P23_05875 [Micrococcaceae bacterium]|nr:hypothetical protein [Micrococcaceae bacterium]
MEILTSTILGLIAASTLLAALVWVLVRSLPRTRGQLRTEAARLDGPSRRSAATLLSGWGGAGGWALAAGIGTYLLLRMAGVFWHRRVVDAALAPLEEANNQYDHDYQACEMLSTSEMATTDAATAKCLEGLIQPPTVIYNDAAPMLLAMLAPVLAALVALAVLAWILSRHRSPKRNRTAVISAGLRPRGIFSFGPRWALAIPSITALVLLSWLVVTGLFSSRNEFGRYAVLTVERHVSVSDPSVGRVPPLTPVLEAESFPGWYYGVPVVLASLMLLVLSLLLLRTLARSPRSAERGLLGVDDMARVLKAKLVTGLSGAGLLATLASVAAMSGGAMLTLAGDERMDGASVEHFYHDTMLSGVYVVICAILFSILALLMVVLALAAVLELSAARRLAVAVALGEEPEPGPRVRQSH